MVYEFATNLRLAETCAIHGRAAVITAGQGTIEFSKTAAQQYQGEGHGQRFSRSKDPITSIVNRLPCGTVCSHVHRLPALLHRKSSCGDRDLRENASTLNRSNLQRQG